MNEAPTRFDLIDPALREAGWTEVPQSNIKVAVITAGRIIGKNHKGELTNPEGMKYKKDGSIPSKTISKTSPERVI